MRGLNTNEDVICFGYCINTYKQICSNQDEWKKYLTVAVRFYKYPFND